MGGCPSACERVCLMRAGCVPKVLGGGARCARGNVRVVIQMRLLVRGEEIYCSMVAHQHRALAVAESNEPSILWVRGCDGGPVVCVAGVGVCIVHRIAGAPSRRPTCVVPTPDYSPVESVSAAAALVVPRAYHGRGAVIPATLGASRRPRGRVEQGSLTPRARPLEGRRRPRRRDFRPPGAAARGRAPAPQPGGLGAIMMMTRRGDAIVQTPLAGLPRPTTAPTVLPD